MFGLAFFLIFLTGCIPFLRTVGRYAQERSAGRTPSIPGRRWSAGLLLIAADAAALGLLAYTWDTWGEALWFEELGQAERFWTVFWARCWLFLAPFALLLPGCSLYLRSVYRRVARQYAALPFACGLLLAVLLAAPVSAHWAPILAYLNQVPVAGSPVDPIFGKGVNFYLFDLGMYKAAYVWLLWLLAALLLASGLLVALGSAVTAVADAASRSVPGGPGRDQALVYGLARTVGEPAHLTSVAPHLFALIALLFFASAWGFQLEKYGLMYSPEGVVRGAGYTDHQVRVPMFDLMTVVDLLLGAACLAAAGLRRFRDWSSRRRPLIGMVAARLLLSALSLWAVPNLVYRLNVKNNEVTLESPYIEHNIRMTRAAYNIDAASMTEKEFVLEPELTREVMDANQNTLREVRLWDYRALHAVLMQTQKVQMYYHFYDVDVDRYRTSKGYHQVMLAARELDMSRVPQRWVNTTLQYTHGYGLVMNPVNVFMPNGNPEFWVSDVAPVKVTVPELELQRPGIYYGERTDGHVYTNTTQQEFDYPAGESNAYTTYTGTGGVRLSSLWRKLVFGWKFDSHRILMSSYFTDDSRILFRRSIRERVSRLAPFLTLDRDEYPVNYQGRILWVCDAYTTSTMYPYSEPYRGTVASLQGISYIRNSVKAVVDAYDGSVELYVFDEQDPIVATWGRIFPGLLKSAAHMPAGLREHIRYPIDLFRVQAEVYCKYHMSDPQLYYNNGDLWELSKELIGNDPVPIEPYYVIVQMPGMEAPEFILMEPFTQATNPRMTGWMAGLCDGERYGKLVVYLFPKGHYVPGTLQVEGKISSDEVISAQLMQWNMKGSEVVRGHLLVIPLIGNRIVCFEPIYLQASAQGAKIPTLTRVVAVHVKPDNDMRIRWGGNLPGVAGRAAGRQRSRGNGTGRAGGRRPLGRRGAAPGPGEADGLQEPVRRGQVPGGGQRPERGLRVTAAAGRDRTGHRPGLAGAGGPPAGRSLARGSGWCTGGPTVPGQAAAGFAEATWPVRSFSRA